MTNKIKSNLLATLVFLTISASAFAQATPANDSVRWDENASQWVYTLYNPNGNGQVEYLRYTPRTVIDPKVKSSLHWSNGNFEYSYRVRNGQRAKQEIKKMEVQAPVWNLQPFVQLNVVPDETQEQMQLRGKAYYAKFDKFEKETLDQPPKWEPFLRTKHPERVYFGWYARAGLDNDGIKPSHTTDGFKVTRSELPGASLMVMQGNTKDYMNAPN